MMLFKLQIIGKASDLFAFSNELFYREEFVTIVFPLDYIMIEDYEFIHALFFKLTLIYIYLFLLLTFLMIYKYFYEYFLLIL